MNMTLEICRICGSNGDLKNIFSEGNDELLEQIRLCANIQIDIYDCLPKFICNECEEGLAFSYRLRKRGEETEKKLRQDIFLTSIEPYSMGDENIITSVDSDLMEEFCDEELWIKDEGSLQFNEDEVFIDRVSESNEDILQNLEEVADEKDEYWENLENLESESYSETGDIGDTADSGDIIETIIEPVGIFKVAVESTPSEGEIHLEAEPSLEKMLNTIDNAINTNHTILNRCRPARPKHACDFCPKTFKTSSHLSVHKDFHALEKPYSCEICRRTMRYANNLRVHMQTMHKNIFINGLELVKDENDSEVLSQFPENCKELTQTFWRNDCRVFKCTLCEKISNSKSKHLYHCRMHLGEKPFKCKTCQKSFNLKQSLKEHEVTHSGLKRFKCHLCFKSFKQHSALSKHAYSHTDVKSFGCGICGAFLKTPYALKTHQRIHSRPSHSEVYGCGYENCNKTYKERLGLLAHMREHQI